MIFNQILGRKVAVRAIEPPRHWLRAVLAALVLGVLIYYLGGALVVHTIDDDLTFTPEPVTAQQSQSVDMAARLIAREVSTHHWTANDPFFLPGAILDNMPNYQQGIIAGVSGFVAALQGITAQDNGRTDPRLDLAASMLSWPGTVWMFNPEVSWWPIAAAEEQYQKATEALLLFNQTLGDTNGLPRRGEDLILLLDWLIQDLDLLSRISAEHLDETADIWMDFDGDDLFYFAKGRLYADGMLLHYIGQDYATTLRHKVLESPWQELTTAVQDISVLNPLMVSRGDADSLWPNHIVAQAYLMLRAKELAESIRKSLMDSLSGVPQDGESSGEAAAAAAATSEPTISAPEPPTPMPPSAETPVLPPVPTPAPPESQH